MFYYKKDFNGGIYMGHSQRKAWAMKHPALAKAFAVVLAVMNQGIAEELQKCLE